MSADPSGRPVSADPSDGPDDVQPVGPVSRPKTRGMLLRYCFVAAVVIALAVLVWQQRDEVAQQARIQSAGEFVGVQRRAPRRPVHVGGPVDRPGALLLRLQRATQR